MRKMDTFSNAEDEQLVHLISCYPQIYDPKDKAYKLQTMKEPVWKEIAEGVNKNGKCFQTTLFYFFKAHLVSVLVYMVIM